jgi:hypothetical protein
VEQQLPAKKFVRVSSGGMGGRFEVTSLSGRGGNETPHFSTGRGECCAVVGWIFAWCCRVSEGWIAGCGRGETAQWLGLGQNPELWQLLRSPATGLV